MEEHHIEVAIRAERASPVAPDREKGQVKVGFSNGTIRHAGEPFVRFGGVGPTEIIALEIGPRKQDLTPFSERRVRGHCGNVALRL